MPPRWSSGSWWRRSTGATGSGGGTRRTTTDPRNLFLNDVLDRETGDPITLGIVVLEVGWRLGLPWKESTSRAISSSATGGEVDAPAGGSLQGGGDPLRGPGPGAPGPDVRWTWCGSNPDSCRPQGGGRCSLRVARNLKGIHLNRGDPVRGAPGRGAASHRPPRSPRRGSGTGGSCWPGWGARKEAAGGCWRPSWRESPGTRMWSGWGRILERLRRDDRNHARTHPTRKVGDDGWTGGRVPGRPGGAGGGGAGGTVRGSG